MVLTSVMAKDGRLHGAGRGSVSVLSSCGFVVSAFGFKIVIHPVAYKFGLFDHLECPVIGPYFEAQRFGQLLDSSPRAL